MSQACTAKPPDFEKNEISNSEIDREEFSSGVVIFLLSTAYPFAIPFDMFLHVIYSNLKLL